jgi:hypothetical protein
VAEIRFEPATLAHADMLAPLLRQADIDEVLASHGQSGAQVLRDGVAASKHAVAMFLGGEIAAIFGLVMTPQNRFAALGPDVNCVWYLTGKAVCRHPIAFVKGGKRVLAVFRQLSPWLYNWVDVRYVQSVRLFERLGFSMGPPTPRGLNGELFRLVLIQGG